VAEEFIYTIYSTKQKDELGLRLCESINFGAKLYWRHCDGPHESVTEVIWYNMPPKTRYFFFFRWSVGVYFLVLS
jgi:hypothetical protein